jgi:undecaprenyl-diphosphatase
VGDSLSKLDQQASIFLNHLGAPWLDPLMIVWSSKWIWLPMYGLLLIYLFRLAGGKKIWLLLLSLVLLILLADQTASGIFKPLFERLRPCHEPEMLSQFRVPDGCGSRFGFASSHSANTMAIAVFFALIPGLCKKSKIWMGLLFWAILSGWSRIYLGMHYLGDVIGGFAIGAFWAGILQLSLRHLKIYETPAD